MAKRNLTLQLDEEMIRRAKEVAAERGVSVSRLVARALEELVLRQERYEEAREGALEALATVGQRGGRRWSREVLHDR